MNEVLQGDCLEVLAGLPAGCVDLIYADPPFATGRDWGQFDDRWEGGLDGYLDYMRPRLEQCRRVLADTGSMYLHCDTTASHYLKVMLDDIFGREQFRNEIVWCYTGPGSALARQFPRKHDTIFWYSKGSSWAFNPDDVRIPYSSHSMEMEGSVFTGGIFAGTGIRLNPAGKVPESWWRDFALVAQIATERNGYPTQKPVRLLDRIIRASSNEGDVVADPFCGSGTSLVAAKMLGRRWFGCDVNAEAVLLAKSRLGADGCVQQREMF